MPIPDELTLRDGETEPHNLWNEALNTVEVEFRSSLDPASGGRSDFLSNVLKVAQEKRQVCAKNRWTFKKRCAETVILRDVMEKIVSWIEKLIAVGDVAMQYDQVHAAPVWAAFRFVLQVKINTSAMCVHWVDYRKIAVNDKRALGEAIENLEAVSYLITRLAILEKLYLQHNSETRDKFLELVIRLYSEILRFLAKAKNYFQSSAKGREKSALSRCHADGFSPSG